MRGLKQGGRLRQSLGEARPHQVFSKKNSDKNIPMFSNNFIFILRRGSKIIILQAAVGSRAAGRESLV